MSIPSKMTSLEIRASAWLASIFALRMLGLFLILPVFALHAPSLPGGNNATLVGLALGMYGLTQACLQIAFGVASDKYGRKPVIVLGLIIFAVGSFVAAAAPNIYISILGRAIQGAGAISAAVTATIADVTREEHRTKAMAMVGASIGLVFAGSLIAAPVLYAQIGMAGIFNLTGVLALAAIGVILFLVPKLPHVEKMAAVHNSAREISTLDVLKIKELQRLNFGVFALHMVQMAMFVVVPTALVHSANLPASAHWQVYLPVVLISFVLMLPAIIWGEKQGKMKTVFVAAIALLLAVQAALFFALHSRWPLIMLLLLFFVAFNILEASLPSMVSRIAPPTAKGAALGVYNTAQALGLFVGGAAGGWLVAHINAESVFVLGAVLIAAWWAIAAKMQPILKKINKVSHRRLNRKALQPTSSVVIHYLIRSAHGLSQ